MSTSALQTSDIDWKQIEVKPDNWEMIQNLIGSAMEITTPHHKKETESILTGFSFDPEFILDHLISVRWKGMRSGLVFKETLKYKEEQKTRGAGASGSDSKKKKKVIVRKVDEIRMKNAQRMIIKDLEKIHFEKNRPTVFQYQYDMTFVIMMMEWWAMLECMEQRTELWTESLVAGGRVFRRMVDKMDTPLTEWMKKVHDAVYHARIGESIIRYLFHNPKLMMFSVAEKYAGSVSLYEKQKELIEMMAEAVINDTPIMIGNRMPPGTGKTFLTVPLAQALQPLRRPKTILFCCPNILVRNYVASIALLGHDLHLWMGCYTRSSSNEEFFMIRPHKRCFPSIWKQVYKEDSEAKYGDVYQQFDYYMDKTKHRPDILIVDPRTCLSLLSNPDRRDMFIAYIDEVIGSTETTQFMTSILHNLPMQSVIMSAILPHFDHLPFLTSHIRTMHPGVHTHMVDASGVTISCSMIGPDGRLNLPHHYIDGIVDIPTLIKTLESDPLTRRMYAPSDVLEMSIRLKRHNVQRYGGVCDWRAGLPHIGHLEYTDILKWWIRMLEKVYAENDTDAWHLLCAYKPLILSEKPVFTEMFGQHAFMFPGKHLHILENDTIYDVYEEMCERHLNGSPDINVLIRKRDTFVDMMNSRLEKIRQQKVERSEKEKLVAEWTDEFQHGCRIAWPMSFVINSEEHFRRFHPEGRLPPGVGLRRPVFLEKEQEDAFPDSLIKMISSGSILYEERNQTEHQRRMILRLMNHMNFITSGEEIVFGTNIDSLTGLSIDRRFGEKHNRSVLYQLIGRTGRTGMSYQARVVVDSYSVLKKIMTPTRAGADDDPDIQCLWNAWQNLSWRKNEEKLFS